MGFKSKITDKDDAAGMLARLGAVAKFGHRPSMQKIGNLWLAQVSASFATETDPYGNPWAKLKRSTIKAKQESGAIRPNRRLFEFGELASSWGFSAGPKRVRIESSDDSEKVARHQYGGVGSDSGEPVPQRQILPDGNDLPPEWTAGVEEAFRDMVIYIEKG